MKKSMRYTIITLSLLMMLSACGKKTEEARSMEQLHSELGIPVRTIRAEKSSFEQNLRYNAMLSGSRESTGQAMLSDVVAKIHFKVGDRVEKDDIVVSFPTDNPSAQYSQASSAFESIEAIYNRMLRLYEENAISLQDFENVRTQYEVSLANLKSSKQMIFVSSPISGVITDIQVNESERVFPGKDLFTVTSEGGYRANLMVPETEISKISKGSKVLATWEGRSIAGKVTSIAMAMDPASKAFRVETEFSGNTGIPYGVTAEILVEILRKNDVFVVDRHILVRENGDSYLWIAEGDRATRRKIELGVNNQLQYEVIDGLQEGDIIISEGIKSLIEGSKIRIIEGS